MLYSTRIISINRISQIWLNVNPPNEKESVKEPATELTPSAATWVLAEDLVSVAFMVLTHINNVYKGYVSLSVESRNMYINLKR
jgi:hypothetical protein